ncbi:META domain-containing protein [Erythrobacter citreus]|uniref:Heat shock protein HslJ n=1 Tax=Qipengyuania citrea TaxID=225971 RepID=A0A6I4U6F7_9SPHN|nr:META domain-containing protein [Qipengyuania citrea]MDQ0566101.1 heat shock protein HslJ [Qipengyuania citrea]MXP34462.1 META domain-containing protein [Qipengyuania citrea]
MRTLACLLLMGLAACNSQADQQTGNAAAEADRETVPALEDITGRWRITSIDGETMPVSGSEPYLAFSADAAGGSVGCNSFGGTTLYAQGRIAVHSWGGDAMACIEPLGKWENTIAKLFRTYPQVRLSGDRLRLSARDHEIELTREDGAQPLNRSPDPMRIPVSDPVSQDLANTEWTIRALDGETASSSPGDRHLRFYADTWQGLASCATLFGTYRADGNRLSVDDEISATEQNCREDHAALDTAFDELMRDDPHYLIGPNGELIIAGEDHVLTGDRAR